MWRCNSPNGRIGGRNMRSGILAAAFILGCATAAQADDIIGSALLYASANQTIATCYFFNASPANVQLSGIQILTRGAQHISLTTNNCPATLLPHHACTISGRINPQPYQCVAIAAPNKTGLRGVMEVEDDNLNVLQTTDLR